MSAGRTSAERARASAVAQGLPAIATDPLAYRDLAVLLQISAGGAAVARPAPPADPSPTQSSDDVPCLGAAPSPSRVGDAA